MSFCPDSLQVPLRWEQVLYLTDDKTGMQKYDSKTSPIPLPHPGLEFRGYVVDGMNVAARFTCGDRGRKGLRCPDKPSGGVNKRFFDGLKACRDDDERKRYKREHAGDYVPRSSRFGPRDPEI